MADGGGGAVDFTLRMVQDVVGPARAAKRAITDVSGGFKALGDSADRAADQVERSWKRQLAAAKNSMAKEHGLASQKAVKQQLSIAKQLSKEKERASVLAGKQAARNANLQDKASKRAVVTHNAKVDQASALKHAKMGGFDSEAMIAGGAEAGIAGVGVAVAAAAAAVGYLTYEFAHASVEAAMFAEKSKLAISFLTNNAPEAAGAFDEVRHMAQGLGLEVHSTIESFQRMLAMQFTIGKSKDLIRMAADMQAIGAGAEEVQRILYAISEIKSMGTLQKRQERMLQMAGISGELIDNALQHRMGLKSHGDVEKARKGGHIGSDVAIDAIMDAVKHKTHETELGQAGAAFASTTLAGMKAQLSGGFENFFIDVGEKITPGLSKIGGLLGGTIKRLAEDPHLSDLGDLMLTKWRAFGSWVEGNWPAIESAVVRGVRMIEDVITGSIKVVGFFTDHWDTVREVIDGVALVFELGAAAAATFLGPGLAVAAAAAAGVVAIAALTGYIAENLGGWYDQAVNWAGNLIRGLVDGIMAGVHAVVDAVTFVGESAKGAFGYSIRSNSPSRDFMEFGEVGIGQGLVVGVDRAVGPVKDSVAGLGGSALTGMAETIHGSSVSLGGSSLSGMADNPGASSGKRGFDGELHLHVDMPVGATEEDGRRYGESMRPLIRSELHSFFDGLQLE